MSLLEELKDAGVIIRAPVGLKKAGNSDVYFDVKKLMEILYCYRKLSLR